VFDVVRQDGFSAIQPDPGGLLAVGHGRDEALEKMGMIDILVNAHGIAQVHPVENLALDA
jgi:predicted RNase H-like HicB family nuclease